MNRQFLRLIAILVFSALQPNKSHAQSFYDYEAELTEAQSEQLRQIEDKFNTNTEEVAEAKVKTAQNDRDKARWEILTQEQRIKILTKLASESKAQAREDHQFLMDLAPIMLFIGQSDSMVAHEGLHRFHSKENETIPEADAILFDKFPFRRKSLPLTPEASERLLACVANYRSFDGYGGGKFCGKFSPDVALVFKKGNDACQILLCFGCGEAVILRDQQKAYLDLDADVYKNLLAVMKTQFEHWPAETP